MKITVDRPINDRIGQFFNWLKERASAPEHEANGDLIADFLEKVLIVEMKNDINAKGVYSEDLEIPDAILMEPLKRVKVIFNKELDKLLGNMAGGATDVDVIEEEPAAYDDPGVAPADTYTEPLLLPPELRTDGKRTYAKRSGNGHAVNKKRDITDPERDSIRAWFMTQDGIIEHDGCVAFQKSLAADLSVFQVTGFTSVVHTEVAQGVVQLKDICAYEEWMRTKYTDLWARYNHPLFVDARTKNKILVAAGMAPIKQNIKI